MNKFTIAIDGYSACGKSTLARQLAQKLDYIYVDSGAMYRAITLYFLDHQVPLEEDSIALALKKINLGFSKNVTTDKREITLNGAVVEPEIRSMRVTNQVSRIAAYPTIRRFAVEVQRKLATGEGVVMDGRDIGTVVFPHAELKIFLTAKVDVRVERRFLELREKGTTVSRGEIKTNLEERDFQDTHRKDSPLRQAEDAIVIDNSDLTREEQLQMALNLVASRCSSTLPD